MMGASFTGDAQEKARERLMMGFFQSGDAHMRRHGSVS